MHRNKLIKQIKEKRSYLCVGLDTDITKIPLHLGRDFKGMLAFNKAIVDATKKHCVSYKINTAFYEALGSKGWEVMEETVAYIPDTHFTIADAKRADIGNTSTQYAKAFFETMNFDAVTVAPYMGEDSIRPFLEYENKWAIVLGLTSNKGAQDFEMLEVHEEDNVLVNGRKKQLYETVIEKVKRWGNTGNLMFVAGATQASALKQLRESIPEHFLLVPGVGFQGGSLEEVSKNALNDDVGLLVNASRAIIYAGSGEDFNIEAEEIARQYQNEMSTYL